MAPVRLGRAMVRFFRLLSGLLAPASPSEAMALASSRMSAADLPTVSTTLTSVMSDADISAGMSAATGM